MTKVPNLIFLKLSKICLKSFLNGNFFSLPSSTIVHIFIALIIPWKNSTYNRSADRCWTVAARLTAQLYLFFITLNSNWCRFNCGSYQQEPFNSNISSWKLFFSPISWLLISATAHMSLFFLNYLYVYGEAVRVIFKKHKIWNKIDLNFNQASSNKWPLKSHLSSANLSFFLSKRMKNNNNPYFARWWYISCRRLDSR